MTRRGCVSPPPPEEITHLLTIALLTVPCTRRAREVEGFEAEEVMIIAPLLTLPRYHVDAVYQHSTLLLLS